MKAYTQKSKQPLSAVASALLAAALVLEILPYGAMLVFAPGPNQRLAQSFSYFSLVPFGYANFFPLPTGILTAAALLLSLMCLLAAARKHRPRGGGLCTAALACSLATAAFSLMPLAFGPAYMSWASYAVSALLLAAAALLLLRRATAGREALTPEGDGRNEDA